MSYCKDTGIRCRNSVLLLKTGRVIWSFFSRCSAARSVAPVVCVNLSSRKAAPAVSDSNNSWRARAKCACIQYETEKRKALLYFLCCCEQLIGREKEHSSAPDSSWCSRVVKVQSLTGAESSPNGALADGMTFANDMEEELIHTSVASSTESIWHVWRMQWSFVRGSKSSKYTNDSCCSSGLKTPQFYNYLFDGSMWQIW